MSASSTADIVNVLDAFAGGELPSQATVAVLSDLDREDAATVAARWQTIAPEMRLGIIALALDIATSNIEMDFQRLAYIALEDPVPGVREAALYVLNDLGGRDTASRITSVLARESNPGVIAAAASAAAPYVLQNELGQLDSATGDQLLAALRDQASAEPLPPEVLPPLVEAAAYAARPWVDELIRTASYSDDRPARIAAVVAMGRTADPAWLEPLEELLESEDAEVRQRAVEACGEIASAEAVDMLAPLLDDDNLDVAAATLNALAEIGGPEALRHLQDFHDRVPESLQQDLDDAREAASGEIYNMSSVMEDDDE